uniref:Uncharacterized protein n=1 Tax=Romanomermis culicivorax TaxID=13658 RepID=A0A915KN30_ROMCU
MPMLQQELRLTTHHDTVAFASLPFGSKNDKSVSGESTLNENVVSVVVHCVMDVSGLQDSTIWGALVP